MGISLPAAAQCPIQRIVQPPDISAFLGYLVLIEGDHLILPDGGAYTFCSRPSSFECSAGAVFAYRREGDRWEPVQTIVPGDIGLRDDFGAGAVLDGDRMIVSSPFRLGDGRLGRFHVYGFDDDLEQWVEREVVEAPGLGEQRKGFGFPIVARGDLLLAAQGELIHRYVEDAEGWQYLDSFGPPDGLSPRSNFGRNIAIGGEWVFISADQDSTLASRHGSVYVYRRNPDDTLAFVEKILPPDLGQMPVLEFGLQMSLDGDTLAISSTSATRDYFGQGVVYIYELREGRWTLVQELTHSEAATVQVFGMGLALRGDSLIAGTRGSRDRVSYVFRRGGDGVWCEVAVLRPGEATPEGWYAQHFGFANAVDGDRVVVGAHSERQTTPPHLKPGAAYVFDLDCEICEPDLDLDGALTIYDFLTFLNLFDAGDPLADFDGDGELTIFDFLAFQAAFDAGCE